MGKKLNWAGKNLNREVDMRSYEQFCALSKALDVIGSRWTLLVVRELLLGPRRFSDLREALPGIANNLLADRLRELERGGIVERRVLDGPGAVQVYALTARGESLDEAVYALMRWGAELMEPETGGFFRPEWLALVLRAYLPATVPDEARVRARVVAGECALTLDSCDGTVRVTPGEPADATVMLEAEPRALLGVASGAERAGAARQRGALRATGPAEAARRLWRLLATVSPR